MKKITGKKYFIILFWTAIMIMVWVGDETPMPFLERFFCFLCFTLSSIIISFIFNKWLFRTSMTSRTLPFVFIAKFLSLTLALITAYALIYYMFEAFEKLHIFNSTRFIINSDNTALQSIIDGLPGIFSINLLFCSILLYYESSELQNTNLKYQLQILHSQINPHFMFNVLNHIYVLMQKDVDMASSLLLKYSDTLRYQLYSGKKDTVTLEQEIQFLKNYIDVEKFRWEGKLEVTCTWEIEEGNREIPPLILITFIENAFKHVSRSSSKKGFINISLEQKQENFSFAVENSKSKDVKKNKNSGIGLENVKSRLSILYPKRYSLNIEETNDVYKSNLTIRL